MAKTTHSTEMAITRPRARGLPNANKTPNCGGGGLETDTTQTQQKTRANRRHIVRPNKQIQKNCPRTLR
eukprot:1018379-Lingulodinium_polyedra.AAC.1